MPQGTIFFIAHPFLYPLLQARLLPAFLLSVFVLLNLFFWTLLPQVLFLKLFHPAGSAWVNAVFLVLGEGAAIVALLFESFLVVCTRAMFTGYGQVLIPCRMNLKSIFLTPSWCTKAMKTWSANLGPSPKML